MRYVNKSLLEADEKYIGHGCNAQGVMGSGVAKAIRDQYPSAFTDYAKVIADFKSRDIDPLGFTIISPQSDGKVIVNLITQRHYGKDGKKYADLSAIQKSILRFVSPLVMNVENRPLSMALPKIGAGLGGLDWKDVEAVLEDIEYAFGVEFVIYYV